MKPFLALLLLFGTVACQSFTPPLLAEVTLSTPAGNLASGTVGVSYAASILAVNGCEPFSWELLSGSLPSGLDGTPSSFTVTRKGDGHDWGSESLDIQGKPTEAGKYSFSLKVIGCEDGTSERGYSITIGPSLTPPSVKLNWDADPANDDVTSYQVLRSTVSGGPYAQIGSSTSTSFTDTTVADGETYYYVVRAVNSQGTSGNSNQTEAVIP
jgi:hypothetical protein